MDPSSETISALVQVSDRASLVRGTHVGKGAIFVKDIVTMVN